jgi:hypothetical protein
MVMNSAGLGPRKDCLGEVQQPLLTTELQAHHTVREDALRQEIPTV